MTTIYFIRHAEPDNSKGGDRERPLTDKGRRDCVKVAEYLKDKGIDAVLSSPFFRAVETVKGFADGAGLSVEIIEDFRERKISNEWIQDFKAYAMRQWEDFSYRLPDGECLDEVQKRNIAALKKVLEEYEGKNIVIGTHGTALSVIIKYFNDEYCWKDFEGIMSKMPWAVKMIFDGKRFISAETVEI